MSEVAARYTGIAGTYDAMWSPVIRPMARPAIERLPSGASLVLDVGCGTGALFADLGAAAPRARIVGVDATEAMLRHTRGTVVCGDATRMPLAASSADAAISSSTRPARTGTACSMTPARRSRPRLTTGGR
ncbi:MAG TPA: class I SAM-dependent methyltransferase [Actinomycetota bacterium]|nr:class I SAM-dependent methyltransferase [Actinomycetota bacterium]